MKHKPDAVGVFINYRRQPDLATAGRLHDTLRLLLPETNVFVDVESLAAGRDFAAELGARISQCDVFLIVIGVGWIDVRDENGERRIDRDDDFVRFEIETALRFGRQIVPVLIGDARVPNISDVPPSIRSFLKLNAVTLRHENFLRDCNALAEKIKLSLTSASTQSPNVKAEIEAFQVESPFAQKIVFERAPAWEYLLTAELWDNYLQPALRHARDLSAGLYLKRKTRIKDEQEAISWIGDQVGACVGMIDPLKKLMEVELPKAWGPPGMPGDSREILHACRLMQRFSAAIVEWEENVQAHEVADKFKRLYSLLPGIATRQLIAIEPLPTIFRDGVNRALASPGSRNEIRFNPVFDLPDGWEKNFQRELRRLNSRWFW